MIINIDVNRKIATVADTKARIVCGNSDYKIKFNFSKEWEGSEEKVARFIFNGNYIDVNFSGAECEAPIIRNTRAVKIGVYAGKLQTTTPARVECLKSVLCDDVAGTETGATLPIKGNKGDDGLSAYEIAVKNGFEGTEAEWLESLVGGETDILLTDETLKISAEGVLGVNTTNEANKDNTLPITSGAVYAEIGNIGALLETI